MNTQATPQGYRTMYILQNTCSSVLSQHIVALSVCNCRALHTNCIPALQGPDDIHVALMWFEPVLWMAQVSLS